MAVGRQNVTRPTGTRDGGRPGRVDFALGQVAASSAVAAPPVSRARASGLDALADADVLFLLRVAVGVDAVGGDAERAVGRGLAALLVQLHEDHRVGGPVPERRVHRVRDEVVRVDRALAGDRPPAQFARPAVRAERPRRVAEEVALDALLEVELAGRRLLELLDVRRQRQISGRTPKAKLGLPS